ncbi:MAG TPA: PIN domain-containing protein [Hymenobacter sp.]|uniref:PIN domain-containing protein n=1 Tax=Hymenobacter sp. TaxID=1898978 RepID=UPI002D80961D|nr:PIN domain-containing protein [Hymenobacter sp.]HET9505825.1 PIN domain-containing protein [Hymenobacter sp.]
MAKLILDTSTWLDIAKPRVEEVLAELEEQVQQGITILLTCDIIIDEWDRNKTRVLKEVVASIRAHAKSALKMSELLPEAEKATLISIVEKYTKIESEQERLAEVFFDRIEKLLKGSEVFSISDSIKVDMANRALTKQAPFHNNKNNMADALLYFGAVDHVNQNNQIATDLLFVTSNFKEFNDPTVFNKLHPDLYKGNVHFSNNLAQALKMRKEAIDLMDEYTEYKFWDWIETDAEIARGK